MRLPQISRIITEDMPATVSDWITKLTDPINNFMLTVKNGLNKGITVNENMSGAIKTVTVSNNAVAFTYETGIAPKAVMVGAWTDQTDSTWTPTTGISVKWSFTKNVLYCTFYGLDTGDTYSITLVILND